MGCDRSLLKEEFMEVIAARSEYGFVCPVLLSLDQQGDVTKVIVEALLVELVQHRLTVFGQELIHLTLAVHL